MMSFTRFRPTVLSRSSSDISLANQDLPLIPKVGMTCAVAGQLDQVRWYGRGPQETYWDRKTGGEIGIYRLPVEQMMHPYVRAQDNANRADVRWFTLTNEGRIWPEGGGRPDAAQFLDLALPDGGPGTGDS